MKSLADSRRDAAVAPVPPQAARARRITQLLRNPLPFAVMWTQFAIDEARDLFGLHTSTTFAAAANVVDQCELLRLLGEADREADASDGEEDAHA